MREYGKGKEKFSENQLLRFVQFSITEDIPDEQLPIATEKSTRPNLAKGIDASKMVNKEQYL